MNDRLCLSAYRLVSGALGLGAPLYLYWQAVLGREDPARRAERLGLSTVPRPEGKLALLHTDGEPEASILLPLIQRLGRLGFGVALAINEAKSCRSAAARGMPCLCELSPLDAPLFAARFLDHWQPAILIFCGGGIAPNLLLEAGERKIPVALADARAPAELVLFWPEAARFARPFYSRIEICAAQTERDAERFARLGVPNVVAAGFLKYDVLPAPADEKAVARLMARIGTRPLWIADRIAPGEEAIALKAHAGLSQQFPELLTVIVPQTGKRADALSAEAAKMRLSASCYDHDSETVPLPPVTIVASLDEARLFYRSASPLFAGRSLIRGGGRNPIEPARLGCVILHGPDVEDFADIYEGLDDAGGGVLVADAGGLTEELAHLFSDNARLRQAGRTAAQAAHAFGGASERICQALAPCLAQAADATDAGDV